MKKIFSVLLVIAIALAAAFSLSACETKVQEGGDGGDHLDTPTGIKGGRWDGDRVNVRADDRKSRFASLGERAG